MSTKTNQYTSLFATGSFLKPTKVDPKEAGKDTDQYSNVTPRIPFPDVCRFITDMSVQCDPSTGKPWLVKTFTEFNHKQGCWIEKSEGIYEIPVVLKASDPDAKDETELNYLPNFNGSISVWTTDSEEPVQLIGGQDIPSTMIGTILCMGDGLVPCYFGDRPYTCPIQLGGTMPAADSGIKMWVDGTTPKSPLGSAGEFVELGSANG